MSLEAGCTGEGTSLGPGWEDLGFVSEHTTGGCRGQGLHDWLGCGKHVMGPQWKQENQMGAGSASQVREELAYRLRVQRRCGGIQAVCRKLRQWGLLMVQMWVPGKEQKSKVSLTLEISLV